MYVIYSLEQKCLEQRGSRAQRSRGLRGPNFWLRQIGMMLMCSQKKIRRKVFPAELQNVSCGHFYSVDSEADWNQELTNISNQIMIDEGK